MNATLPQKKQSTAIEDKEKKKTVLAVSEEMHLRVGKFARHSKISVKTLTDILLRYSLDKLATGKVRVINPGIAEEA